MLYYERKFKKKGYDVIIGVDEAGRGPLAGPVVAAAVRLNKKRFQNRIDDSKRLTRLQREKAFSEIVRYSIIGIGIINEKDIDDINILQATRMAMEIALASVKGKLSLRKHERAYVLVDGNVRLDINLPYMNIIDGDAKSKSIASASIVAKVVRDHIMRIYDAEYPGYGFTRHKGYGTREHYLALQKFGPCLIHRSTFLKCIHRHGV